MNDRAIEHAGLDPWEIRAHLERLGHDPAARLIRQLCDALPMPSRSVGETAPGKVITRQEIGEFYDRFMAPKPSPMTELLEDVAEDARRITGIDRAAKRPAFPKPNFGPGVEDQK
jgi:hypothetical protein